MTPSAVDESVSANQDSEASPSAVVPSVGRPIGLAFAGFAVAAVGSVAAAVLAAIVIAAVITGTGGDVSSVERRLTSDPMLMIAIAAPAQLAILVTTFAFALLTRRPIRSSLGWQRPALSFGEWTAILIGSGIPFAVAIGAASIPPSLGGTAGLPEMWRTMAPFQVVVWVLFIGAVPGVVEELFFRGYVQRRFLERWKAPMAIGVTSVLFALLHMDPPAMALALVLGVWLGIVAWRTGSIWPGIAIHASINGLWNLSQIVVRKSELDEQTIWIGVGVVGAVSLVAFVMSIRILIRKSPPVLC